MCLVLAGRGRVRTEIDKRQALRCLLDGSAVGAGGFGSGTRFWGLGGGGVPGGARVGAGYQLGGFGEEFDVCFCEHVEALAFF